MKTNITHASVLVVVRHLVVKVLGVIGTTPVTSDESDLLASTSGCGVTSQQLFSGIARASHPKEVLSM